MKKAAFPLAALSILLAAALVASIAARTVSAPPTGKTVSSGVLTVPSVLGLTADELTFSPWPMYNVDKRNPIPVELLDDLSQSYFLTSLEDICKLSQKDLVQEENSSAQSLQTWLGTDALDFQYGDIVERLEWNLAATLDEIQQQPAPSAYRIYCKDVPATADLTGKPDVSLSFALSVSASYAEIVSASAVFRPANQREITQRKQDAARAQVESDLRDFLLFQRALGVDPYNIYIEITGDFFPNLPAAHAAGVPLDVAWHSIFGERSLMCPYLYKLLQCPSDYGVLDPLESLFSSDVYGYHLDGVPDGAPLDQILENLEQRTGWSVQIITTATQIVTLFSMPGTYTVGIFYDIQLGCYSGYGLENLTIG